MTHALLALALLAAPPAIGEAAPKVSTADVKGRALAIPDGRVQVLSFASKSNGEVAGDVTRAVRVRHPDVEVISFVDLSGFPGILHGMIRSKILGRQPKAVSDAADAFTKAGKTPPADLDARIHIVPDFDETPCKAYGANDTGHHYVIAVITSAGTIAAMLPGDPSVDDVDAAVTKALAR